MEFGALTWLPSEPWGSIEPVLENSIEPVLEKWERAIGELTGS